MRNEYDLKKMKSRPNPYAKRLKRQLTIRMGVDIIDYFKAMAAKTGIPYQNLINLYLRECVVSQRKLQMKWASRDGQQAGGRCASIVRTASPYSVEPTRSASSQRGCGSRRRLVRASRVPTSGLT